MLLKEYLDHAGVACLSLGTLGVILDLPNWESYFHQRLADVVVERKFLRTLGSDELIQLQIQTLKAFFKVEDLDKEGLLLNYFTKRIQRQIAQPFREDANTTIVYKHDPENSNLLLAEETARYTCRRVGLKLQEEVTWMPQPGEYKTQNIRIVLELPADEATKLKDSTILASLESVSNDRRRYVVPNAMEASHKRGEGWCFPLSKFQDCDQLEITISATYTINRERFTSWTMAHPTRRFSLVASFPEDLDIWFETLGNISDVEIRAEKKVGLFSASYSEWVLPGSGVVFQFLPRSALAPFLPSAT